METAVFLTERHRTYVSKPITAHKKMLTHQLTDNDNKQFKLLKRKTLIFNLESETIQNFTFLLLLKYFQHNLSSHFVLFFFFFFNNVGVHFPH